MTKKKNLIARICGLLIVLTLISCCFLGTTFARYTSSGDGTASVQVAKWDIDIGNEGEFAVNWNGAKLSPSENGYNSEEPGPVSNETEVVAVATVINNGDVDALVSVAQGAFSITVVGEENPVTAYDQLLTEEGEPAYYLADVEGLFKLYLYTNETGTTPLTNENLTVTAKGGTATIYGKVTWTTNYRADDENLGAAQDALDTWVGENVTSINWNLTLTAVQSSTQP